MENNKRYSFFQLFSKGIEERPGNHKLVIPLIQRDYAQGRENDKATEVRHDFLNQLFDYMTAATGSHDLDFVYGTTSLATDAVKKKEFIPLDGQQRLTTLFLIHWYLAIRRKETDESKNFLKTMQTKSGNLIESLFTYRTRSSAMEFCNGIIDESFDYSEVFKLDPETNKRIYKHKLSDYIRNSNWFYPDWNQDPTVCGMLTMLDAIDEKFDKADHAFILWRLMSDSDPSVTFIFMNLEDYNLTDDLYIKMNSRGKPLTSFENFKAKYEQYISLKEKGGGCKSLKALYDEISERSHPIIKSAKDNFAFNIDGKWAELFWEYSKKEIKTREAEIAKETAINNGGAIDRLLSETLDLKISRFITMVLVNQYALSHNTGKEGIPRELMDMKQLSFVALSKLDALSSEGIVLMTRMFELFANRPLCILPDWSKIYYDEREVFESLINGKDFTVTKRYMLYAYLQFRLRFGDDNPEYLVEWMRLLYNMILDDNSIQDITRNTYRNAIESTNQLLDLLSEQKEPSVITLLSSDRAPEEVDFFPEYQFKEEVLKSHLLNRDAKKLLHSKDSLALSKDIEAGMTWEEIILKLEQHPYFTGQIGFLLEMAGINDYYKVHKKIDWSENDDISFKNEVVKLGRLASAIFDGGYSNRIMAKTSLFERAMLSIHPDYCRFNSQNAANLLNSVKKRVGSNNLIRDLSWKNILRLDTEKQNIRNMVKDLFMKIDIEDPQKSLTEIIDNNTEGPQWRKDLIKYEYLMGKSPNGYFGTTEDGHRILNNSIQFSMGDHEIYSLVLYNEYLIIKWDSIKNLGFWIAYGNSNSWSEIPFVKISNGDVTVKIKSHVEKDNGELKCHYLWIDSNSDYDLEKYLQERGFIRQSERDTVYRRNEMDWDMSCKIEDYRKGVANIVIEFIKDLADFLNKDDNGQQ